jgi:hypothetical protein
LLICVSIGQEPRPPPNLPDLEPYIKKQQSHRHILEHELDQIAIKEAFRAFKNLQHVQLVKLQDIDDENFENLQEMYPEVDDWIQLDWVSACVYGTRSIAEALLITGSPCTRFSSPHLNSNSAMILAQNPPGLGLEMANSLDNLASRLTCLELHFDQDWQFSRIDRLHALPFGPIFSHATNLEALHVGFPEPIAIGLEDVFHSIKWDKLVAFGIQGWCLSAEEIIAIARRHKDKLRGLRLRSVYLKPGSRWSDVLHYLRNEMKQLEWVSLRRIGYQSYVDDRRGVQADVTDVIELDSDRDSSDDEFVHEAPAAGIEQDDNDANSDAYESSDEQETRSNAGSDIHMDFPSQLQREYKHYPSRFGRFITLEDAEDELQDDQEVVTNETRRRWEKWVVKS